MLTPEEFERAVNSVIKGLDDDDEALYRCGMASLTHGTAGQFEEAQRRIRRSHWPHDELPAWSRARPEIADL